MVLPVSWGSAAPGHPSASLWPPRVAQAPSQRGIWVLRAWYKQAFTCDVQQDIQRRALSGLGL